MKATHKQLLTLVKQGMMLKSGKIHIVNSHSYTLNPLSSSLCLRSLDAGSDDTILPASTIKPASKSYGWSF